MAQQNITYFERLTGLDYWVDNWANDFLIFYNSTIDPILFQQKVIMAIKNTPSVAGKIQDDCLVTVEGDTIPIEALEANVPSINEVYDNPELLKRYQIPPLNTNCQLFKFHLINDSLNKRSIVSFTCSHALMDGGGSYLFWCIMTSMYRNLPVPPLMSRADLLNKFPKKPIFADYVPLQNRKPSLQSLPCSSKIFIFPYAVVKKVQTSLKVPNISLNDTLCGLIGNWIYQSLKEDLQSFNAFEFEFMVDLRRFLGVENFMGNMCCNKRIKIDCKDTPLNISQYIASKTREIVGQSNLWAKDYVCEKLHLTKTEAYTLRQRLLYDMEEDLAFRFLFNNLLGFNFKDIILEDPAAGLLPVDVAPFSATFVFSANREDFVLWISLPAKALQKVELLFRDFIEC